MILKRYDVRTYIKVGSTLKEFNIRIELCIFNSRTKLLLACVENKDPPIIIQPKMIHEKLKHCTR